MVRASPAGIPSLHAVLDPPPATLLSAPLTARPRREGAAHGGPQGSEGLRVGGEPTPGPGVLLMSPRSRWGHAAAWVGEGLGPELESREEWAWVRQGEACAKARQRVGCGFVCRTERSYAAEGVLGGVGQ